MVMSFLSPDPKRPSNTMRAKEASKVDTDVLSDRETQAGRVSAKKGNTVSCGHPLKGSKKAANLTPIPSKGAWNMKL